MLEHGDSLNRQNVDRSSIQLLGQNLSRVLSEYRKTLSLRDFISKPAKRA